MAKSSVQYVCSECGWNGPKWYGRCPECGQWGTVEEFHEARPAAGSRTAAPGRTSRTQSVTVANNARSAARPITEVGTESVERLGTGFSEFDRVLGGGVVPGSVTLIAGEPGIGKSTLLLQTAISRALWRETVRSEGQVSGLPNSRAGRRATHRTRCRCGATHHQHTPTPCCTFPARNHRRRFVCALPASMRWSRTCYWPPPPTCPQYWG